MGNILGKTFLVLGITLFGFVLHAQDPARDLVREGNKLYASGSYEEAEKKYAEAESLNTELTQALFNKADALYKKGDLENAAKLFKDIAASATDKDSQSAAYHNLGNTLMKTENYSGSVNAYKEALRRNPSDEDTRYNLSYALQKLKEQQEQQQQDKNQDQEQNKDKEEEKQQDQQDQEENKDGKNEDQDQDQDEKKQDDGNNKGDEDEKENQPEGSKPETGDDKREQQTPGKMSKEDAERLLKALQNNERNTQEKVNAKRVKVSGKTIEKDW